MKFRQAMMTIEVLVAFVIIFLTIVLSASSAKYFNMSYMKKDQYVDMYATILSIKDKIAEDVCSQNINGTLNQFTYTATCVLKREKPNYEWATDIDEVSGNSGPYMLQLYQVTLEIKKEKIDKEIKYFVTKAIKR